MQYFAEQLEKVNDEALRNFTVDELMSDAGTRMLPLFKRGAAAIKKERKEAEERAKVLEKLVPIQQEFNKEITVAKEKFKILSLEMLIRFLPAMKWVAKNGDKVVTVFGDWIKKSSILEAALLAMVTIAGIFALSTIGILSLIHI